MLAKSQSHYLKFIEKAAGVLLLVYPTLMLTVKGGMNGVFLLVLLLALAVKLVRPVALEPTVWAREWTIYAVSMLSVTVAVFLSQSYHLEYSAHSYDGPSRYWLAVPVFLLLQRLDLRIFTMLQYAFPLAAISGYFLSRPLSERAGIDTLDLIHFGDFALILGVLSLFSIDWFAQDKWLLRTLKTMGGIAGLAASLASGSRGGWLAIPVFIIIFIYFKQPRRALVKILALSVVLLLGVSILYSNNPNFHLRVDQLKSDVAALDQGNLDTSIGVRWQLYKAAGDIFSRNPVFGVGPDEGFAREMTPMMEAGKITPYAAEFGRGEVHNDILCKTAGMGIFGLVAILSVYLVPGWLFWKATKSALRQVRRAGILGIVFVSGYFVFGLTVETLNLTMAIAFYSFTVAVLLAACYNIHHSEQTTNH